MKIVKYFMFVLLACTLCFSCGGTAGDDVRSQTLVVVLSSDAITFDPGAQNDSYSANAMLQMYEGLVTLSQSNEVIPVLAENYEISSDGMNYVFYLRKGIKFHNGEELTADDVVFSFKKAFASTSVAHIF